MLRGLYYACLALVGLAIGLLGSVYLPDEANAGSWTGCYGGAAAGYAHGLTDTTLSGGPVTLGVDGLGAQGAVLTGLAGCDVQAARMVFGVWGDYSHHPDTTFSVTLTGAPTILKASLENSWAVGGRVGYLVTQNTMGYVLLGYTQAEHSAITSPAAAFSLSVPDLTGYVVGGGVETRLFDGWFLQAQATYADYRNESIALGPGVALGLDVDELKARVGVLYRFSFSNDFVIPGADVPAHKPIK